MGSEAENTEKEGLGTRSEIETVASCKRRLKASIPAEKVKEELDKNYRELTLNVQLPGFRRGRVPRKLLEARYGEEIEEDVKKSLVALSLSEVVEEKDLKVIGTPKFDNILLAKEGDLSYEVEIEVRPEFQLAEYKGIEVAVEEPPVTDVEVAARLLEFRKKRGRLDPIDPAQAGPDDRYTGRYELHRDGVRVKTSGAVTFIPAQQVLESFIIEDLPARCAAWDRTGTPLEIDVTVPPDYADEVLRGSAAKLTFHLEQCERVEPAELNDDFARSFGAEDVKTLEGHIREMIEADRKKESNAKLDEQILKKITDGTPMDLPEGLIESQRIRARVSTELKLVEKGLSPELVKKTLDERTNEDTDLLKQGLKAFFVLEKIAEDEKIFVTEREIEDRVALLARAYGVPFEQLKHELDASGKLAEFRFALRHEKVKAFLRKKAKVAGQGDNGSAADTLKGPPAAAEPAAGAEKAEASAPGPEAAAAEEAAAPREVEKN
jgi:trigger factor